jgi:hypothetical protein
VVIVAVEMRDSLPSIELSMAKIPSLLGALQQAAVDTYDRSGDI